MGSKLPYHLGFYGISEPSTVWPKPSIIPKHSEVSKLKARGARCLGLQMNLIGRSRGNTQTGYMDMDGYGGFPKLVVPNNHGFSY